MGRALYEGVYDPESPYADADGWRSDVLEKLRDLDMTVMRYPGGNFASGYHWRDGVGPREHRPRLRELAWNSIEPNHVGTDEFVALARRMSWEPMLTVNLGTGSPEEARNWVEYCNAPPGTRYADMRAANGVEAPHGIQLWCLGNEMDGPWQLGHVPADEYARRAQQAAKMMKDVDRSIEVVVCGSSNTWIPTYLEWDRAVLEHVGDLADYVSLHNYVGNRTDTMDFLAVTNAIDRQIEEVDAICRYAQGKRRATRRPFLSFDEWNVWYKTMSGGNMDGAGRFAPPLIEEVYNLEDALVVSGFLQSFLRHADVLKVANLAQIVNVIAPILTRKDDLLVQSIYWPFAMVSKRREGVSLRTVVDGPRYPSQSHGMATHVDASTILARDHLHVFLTNRDDRPRGRS
jgi:alpha-N-arabinofuranosidase